MMQSNVVPNPGGATKLQDQTHPYTARIHTTLESIRETWLRFQTAGVMTAYQRYEWVDLIIKHLMPSKGGRLLVVELLSGTTGEPIMIVPLMQRHNVAFSEITWLSCDVCDYSSPLLARPVAFTKEQAEAAWTSVLSVLPKADVISIDAIPAEIIKGTLNPLSQLASAKVLDETTSGFALSGSTETLLTRLCRPSFVKSLNKNLRRLEREGAVYFEEALTIEECNLIYGILVEQRLKRFREVGRFDLLTSEKYRRFYLDAALKAGPNGAVRIFGLRVGEQWVATCYMLVNAGSAHGILLALDDERWKRVSPGLMMIAKAMEWANRKGLHYFDLSVGSQYYKNELGAESHSLLAINKGLTFKGIVVLTIRYRVTRIKKWARKQATFVAFVRACRARLRLSRETANKGANGDA